MNFRNKSTEAVSIYQFLLDLTGGALSLIQVLRLSVSITTCHVPIATCYVSIVTITCYDPLVTCCVNIVWILTLWFLSRYDVGN